MTAQSELPASDIPAPDFVNTRAHQFLIGFFVVAPTVGLLVLTPLAAIYGWFGWTDAILMAVFYLVSILGVTVGFHRHFTHGAFKAPTWVRVTLGLAGQMAVQGALFNWTADHRKHHAFSDKAGDPHSPWLFGDNAWALIRGFWHAHMGWLFLRQQTDQRRYIPDLLQNRPLTIVNRLFAGCMLATFLLPAALGWIFSGSLFGALTAFIWAGVIRVGVSHHVTWSVNSICHMWGAQPYRSRDQSRNLWLLAIPSLGESWHNLHHADPTCARHGVGRGQIDVSARIIWIMERFGLVHAVRWPTPRRLERIRAAAPEA